MIWYVKNPLCALNKFKGACELCCWFWTGADPSHVPNTRSSAWHLWVKLCHLGYLSCACVPSCATRSICRSLHGDEIYRIHLHFLQSTLKHELWIRWTVMFRRCQWSQWRPVSGALANPRKRSAVGHDSPFLLVSIAINFQVQIQLRPSCVPLMSVWVFSRYSGFHPHWEKHEH